MGSTKTRTWALLALLAILLVLSGCGLIGAGPGGETAPLLFGFQRAVSQMPTTVPTDPVGLIAWIVGLGAAVAAGVGGTIAQGRKIKRLAGEIKSRAHI
jgi:hypothetical protein